MTKEEELQALREENRILKALVAELLPLQEQLAQAHARIKDLEDRLAKDSRTSSKPPSSDGLARLLRSSPRPSGKRPGGQAGHPGHTLAMVEQPDEVVRHRPEVCSQCREDLSAVPGSLAERRQVLDVPEIRLLAHEHQIEAVCCPTCHTTSLGSFPAAVSAPVQYGPHLQALAVYLHQGQLLPTARTCLAALKMLENISALQPAVSDTIESQLKKLLSEIFTCPSPSQNSIESELERGPVHRCGLSFENYNVYLQRAAQVEEEAQRLFNEAIEHKMEVFLNPAIQERLRQGQDKPAIAALLQCRTVGDLWAYLTRQCQETPSIVETINHYLKRIVVKKVRHTPPTK